MELEYKNLEEQIELIKSKNIVIKNEKKAKEILFRENYYNLITGYKDVFLEMKKRDVEVFQSETYFEEIYAIYKFDRELRNEMLHCISIIESNLKSCISNVFSAKYGTKDYLKKENFYVPLYREIEFQEFLTKINENLERNITLYPDLKESQKKYQTIPLWMLTTVMTFGTTIKFYEFLKFEDQKEIAKFFFIQNKDISVFLKMLNIVRNISAHGNILFDIDLKISYPIRKKSFFHDSLGIVNEKGYYECGIHDILAVIIILKRFLDYSEFKMFINKFKNAVLDVRSELDELSFSCFLKKMGMNEKILNVLIS